MVLAQNADHFESTLRSAIALDIPAVKASFVSECVATGSLVDPGEFSFDGEIFRRRRGPPAVIDLAKMREASRGEKSKKAAPSRRKNKVLVASKQREASLDSLAD